MTRIERDGLLVAVPEDGTTDETTVLRRGGPCRDRTDAAVILADSSVLVAGAQVVSCDRRALPTCEPFGVAARAIV
jgi:hypothetical protein